MKTILSIYSEGKAPRGGGGTPKTVTLYEVVDNKPVLIGTRTDTWVDQFQLIFESLEHFKALDPKAFIKRDGVGNGYKHYGKQALFEAGFADIHEL